MTPGLAKMRPHWLEPTFAAAAFVAICLGCHFDRLRHPSLFTDDLARISDLQTKPLKEILFRPFQEHMAPLFATVSWVTWHLAGRRLSNAPLAFTLASYVPFAVCLWLLDRLVHRELRSRTTALVAVAAYGLSSLHAEAVYWYSASSFFWALFWTLLALQCAGTAARTGKRSSLVWAALAAALAPACSGVGLLAGPLGAIRVGASADGESDGDVRITQFAPIVPLLGTLLNLAICSLYRYLDVLGSSIAHRADFSSGLIYTFCAPTNVLVPGLFGLPHLDVWQPVALNVALAILALAGVLGWACRSPHRALILGGLWLILGGYAMTYCFRTQQFGAQWLFNVERYHVFPLLGFTLWVALALRPWLSRYDRRPVAGLVAATILAALSMVSHLPGLLMHSRFYQFPTQGLTLAALERLDAICVQEAITRDQLLAALDPIRLRWAFDANPLELLPARVGDPAVPDRLVRPTLLAALSRAEREALWGGMDASRYLEPIDDWEEGDSRAATGRLVGSYRVRAVGEGWCVPVGWPAYLEFEMPAPAPTVAHQRAHVNPRAVSLCVPGGSPGRQMEIWWSGKNEGWSETRSVLWRPDPGRPSCALAVSLERLPHYNPPDVRRIRIMFRSAGQTSVGSPRLLR